MKTFLLDTNLVVALIRSENFKDKISKTYSFPTNRILISVVAQGELESLALQWSWGAKKLQKLYSILGDFVIYPIKVQSIINACACIDAYSQGKLAGRPLPAGMSARNMGKNDLWIAATAHVANATLVSTDNDFGHLDRKFFPLDRIDINLFI